jgi:precorrin-3B synthase
VPAAHALEFVDAVLHAFLDCAHPEQKRLRDVLQNIAPGQFLAQVQQRLSCSLTLISDWQRKPAPPYAHIGIHPQRQHDLCYVGGVPVLGRIDVAQLRVLAELSQLGDHRLRLTPRQSIVLPNIPQLVADNVAQKLHDAGFTINRRDPLAHTIACSGATGCARGLADTKADALLLAEQLGKKFVQSSVHLTGCDRSCAAAHIAPFTLLAVAAGTYHLYKRRQDTATFGEMIARGVDIQQAAALIAQQS